MKLRALFQRFWRGTQKPTETSPPATEGQGQQSNAADSFSTDRPIKSSAEDRFNRWPFANRVVQAIANRADPTSLVIGIYGRYGEGKTSVLNLIRGELQNESNFVVVPFNPWLFGDQSQLLAAFFYTLADGLRRNLRRAKEIGDILSKYSFALAAVKPLGIDLSEAARKLGQHLSSVQLEKQRHKLEDILRNSGKRVVVIIDDIDRLDRTEIQAIFKLVKLAADFERITYVLAFDDEMVAGALAERFPGDGNEAGRSYLEKIIQVPLHLPPADKLTLREATFQAVDGALQSNGVSLGEDEVQRFVKGFTEGLEICLTTPRMVSRYSNAITFAIPQLHGEANIVDCLLIEGLRVFYPNLYSTIRTNSEAFLGPESTLLEEDWKRHAKAVIDRGLKGLDTHAHAAAIELIQTLFPQSKSVLGNMKFLSDLDERLAKEQRVASSDYFLRFFQYAVPLRDLPDRKVQQFIGSLGAATVEEIEAQIRELAGNQRAERLVAKLREREKTLEPVSAEKLALALAGLGTIFPNPESFYPFIGAFSQAAILVANLVKRVPSGEQRDGVAERIMERATPTSLSIEILQWLRKTKDQDESERIVSAEVEVRLERQVADRVAREAETAPPHLTDPKNASRLFNIWFIYGDKESLKTYITRRFDTDPKEAAKFLACYLPTVWSGLTGLPSKGSISRETYDGIANVVAPEKMIEYLRKVYGDRLDDELFLAGHKGDVDARAAVTFVKMHRAVQNEKGKTSQGKPESATN